VLGIYQIFTCVSYTFKYIKVKSSSSYGAFMMATGHDDGRRVAAVGGMPGGCCGCPEISGSQKVGLVEVNKDPKTFASEK
jgi:hypothetical protein